MRLMGWVAAAVFAIDQALKYYVVHGLALAEVRAIDVWPPYLTLRMAWNTGINFGLFAGGAEAARWGLIGIALAISAAVAVWIRRDPPGRAGLVSAGLLIGGALGNVVDRVVYGAVADFLNMSCCGIDNPFSFNVADIAIFAGALGLVVFTGEGGGEKAP